MAMWTACFDASGSEDDALTPFLTVAGFLSTAEQWIALSDLWEKRLHDDGLEYFRMAEFAQSVKQFAGWKEQESRRQQLLGDLIDLIKSHAFRKFGTVVEVAALNKHLDTTFKKDFHLTAYTLAGRSAVGDVRQWCLAEGLLDTPLAFVFEEGDLGQGELRTRLEEDDFPVNFRPKKDKTINGILVPGFIPFQACDILAYEMGLLTKQDRPDSQWRWAAKQLLHFPGRIGIFTAPDIKSLKRDLEAEIKLKDSTSAHSQSRDENSSR